MNREGFGFEVRDHELGGAGKEKTRSASFIGRKPPGLNQIEP